MSNEQTAGESIEPRRVRKTERFEIGPLEVAVSVSVSVQGIDSHGMVTIRSPDPTGPPTGDGSKGDRLGRG